ncbi:hypothetical protein V6N13_074428 [Hibiscus sabdariffa]
MVTKERFVKFPIEILAPSADWVEKHNQVQKRGRGHPKKTIANQLSLMDPYLNSISLIERSSGYCSDYRGTKTTLIVVGDEAIVMERKGPWIGSEATLGSKDFVATTMYNESITRNYVAKCF